MILVIRRLNDTQHSLAEANYFIFTKKIYHRFHNYYIAVYILMKVNNPSPALTRLIAKRLARKVAHTRKMKSKIINKPAKKLEIKKPEAIP